MLCAVGVPQAVGQWVSGMAMNAGNGMSSCLDGMPAQAGLVSPRNRATTGENKAIGGLRDLRGRVHGQFSIRQCCSGSGGQLENRQMQVQVNMLVLFLCRCKSQTLAYAQLNAMLNPHLIPPGGFNRPGTRHRLHTVGWGRRAGRGVAGGTFTPGLNMNCMSLGTSFTAVERTDPPASPQSHTHLDQMCLVPGFLTDLASDLCSFLAPDRFHAGI